MPVDVGRALPVVHRRAGELRRRRRRQRDLPLCGLQKCARESLELRAGGGIRPQRTCTPAGDGDPTVRCPGVGSDEAVPA